MESGSRITRSQAAPNWTAQESLTLVNEIKAVEAECGSTMPSFQKWQLTVAHCNALDVCRSLDQCKRKWESLMEDYRRVKQLEFRHGMALFDEDRMEDLGVPGDFTLELFVAIDSYVKMQGKDASGVDTDLDSDPEAQADDSVFVGSGGSKKQCRRSNSQKLRAEEALHPSWRYISSGITKQDQLSLHYKPDIRVDKKFDPRLEKNYQPSLLVDKVKPPENRDEITDEVEELRGEDETEMMALILQENAQHIHAIVEDDLTNTAADQTDLVRLQADKLIDYLGRISKTLGQLCEIVQERK
ncbi:unnamed protein product [Cuscuta epithymum]|uniref:Myb-like domain-containing protein n=1 Tax=Cuscuta epithymum TaxID=186058 RepID=A0AAV0GF75_9ASTE|nr:unnamed protein product [Cuscuta epithymum]CAH9146505.1 unnamed protein product [Cuscuta epithymum]